MEEPLPLIKPRTRGKQLVRQIARLDRESHETLCCHAHFSGEPPDYADAGDRYANATLVNNLLGKSKQPFWPQAYTDLLQFVILLRRLAAGYTRFA